ncbi:MAG: hypothetical protein PHH13_02815 [Candidatus Peribacteraceae bacterium]|nr:hypothetical protein [Candidatus Peribacteraceae bacterium]
MPEARQLLQHFKEVHMQIGRHEPKVEERHIEAVARALPVEFIDHSQVHPAIAASLTKHDVISAFHAIASTSESDNKRLIEKRQPQDPALTRLTTLYYHICKLPAASTD